MDEQALVELAVRGDAQAFGSLYAHYLSIIYSYFAERCSCADDVEDLTAQVFLNAWEEIDDLPRQGCSFATWLVRIARHLLIDYYVARRSPAPPHSSEQPQADPVAPQFPDGQCTFQEISGALVHLSVNEAQVIVLRFLLGYSLLEAAWIMDDSPHVIADLQACALRAIRFWLYDGGWGVQAQGQAYRAAVTPAEYWLPRDYHLPTSWN